MQVPALPVGRSVSLVPASRSHNGVVYRFEFEKPIRKLYIQGQLNGGTTGTTDWYTVYQGILDEPTTQPAAPGEFTLVDTASGTSRSLETVGVEFDSLYYDGIGIFRVQTNFNTPNAPIISFTVIGVE